MSIHFQCPSCGNNFGLYNSGEAYYCEDCQQGYYLACCNQCDYEEGLSIETPIDEEGYICEKCFREWEAASLRSRFSSRPNFLLCSNPGYFTNGITDKYPISYRLVLLRIIHKIIKENDNLDLVSVKSELQKLIQSIDEKREYSFLAYPDYVEIYVFKDTRATTIESNEVNAILIDKTGGTYPLLFYSNNTEGKKGFRVWALNNSLKYISSNIEKFFLLLNEINENELIESIGRKNKICWELDDWRDEVEE